MENNELLALQDVFARLDKNELLDFSEFLENKIIDNNEDIFHFISVFAKMAFFSEDIINRLKKHGVSQIIANKISRNNIVFSKKKLVRYDYSSIHAHNHFSEKIKPIFEKIKEIEKKSKNIKKIVEIFDEDTGEILMISPAEKIESETIAISFKNFNICVESK